MTLQRTDLIRLFLFLDGGQNSFSEDPVFVNCVEIDGVSESAGELTLAHAPNPELAGDFAEVAAFRTSRERATTSLMLRATVDEESLLTDVQRRRCTFDAQLNIGVCQHVASIDQFIRKEVWEDASLTTRATSKLSAFDSAGVELVTETYGVSIKRRYTVFNPKYESVLNLDCTDFGNNISVLVVPPARCCGRPPGSVVLIGSGNGSGEIGVTYDFARTWEFFDTESTAKFVGGELWKKWAVFAGDAGYCYFINLSSPALSERTRCAAPLLIGFLSDGANAVGLSNLPTAGRIYRLLDEHGFAPTAYTNPAALTKLGDAKRTMGFAVLDIENCVVFSDDGRAWGRTLAYASPVASTPYALVVRGPGCWLISADDALYYTSDYGATWETGSALAYPGPLASATRHVLFSAGWDAANGSVRILRTTDGNATWYEEPNLPGSGLIAESIVPSQVRVAPEDPNLVWIAGDNVSGPCLILGRKYG